MARLKVWMRIEDEAAGKEADFTITDPLAVEQTRSYARTAGPRTVKPGHFRPNAIWAPNGDLRELSVAWEGRETARFLNALHRDERESMHLLVWEEDAAKNSMG